MRVLVIGGAGYVAGLILPQVALRHAVLVFDLRPPAPGLEYIQGDVLDAAALAEACEGVQAGLYLAMGSPHHNTSIGVRSAFDVNVQGVYLALQALQKAGADHFVYASSMSVYEGSLTSRRFDTEDVPPDSAQTYGLTKRLGEEVCRAADRAGGISVNALRFCLPLPMERWQEHARSGEPTLATEASDVARAVTAAIERPFGGFEAFTISGDYGHIFMDMSKARRMLDWAPRARPDATAH